MIIRTDGLEIEVIRKRIKNVHLHVERDGRVYVTAPMQTPARTIEDFVIQHTDWIRKSLERYRSVPEIPERRYETGETVFVLGREYELTFVPGKGCRFFIRDGRAYLIMPPQSAAEERIAYMREVYRAILTEQIKLLFPKWERITGLRANEVRTKYMKTRWGTCNSSAKRIWLSLQLAQHPQRCIEYVMLHELIHFWEQNHGPRFKAHMDRFMPDWREIKKELNKPLRSVM